MTDCEKVIKGLEWILADDRFGFGVNWETGAPRDDYEKAGKIITDTITLLREHEPVEPILSVKDRCYYCGNCDGTEVKTYDHYCPKCGRELKW